MAALSGCTVPNWMRLEYFSRLFNGDRILMESIENISVTGYALQLKCKPQ